MSFVLLIGIIGMLLVILFKSPIIYILGSNNRLVHKLKNAIWFQNHWLSGIFLFAMNAILFFTTGLALYILGLFNIPFVHLILILFAVFGSIYLWVVVNNAWEGSKRNRIKMGTLGSSFYIFLACMFVYWLVALNPSYQGEDTFMRAIGLFFAIIVTTFAFITCLVITGFSKGGNKLNKI